AEGATPLGVLVSLGVPGSRQGRTSNASPAAQIMAGVGAAARNVGASVLGGDLVRSPRYLVDVCVLGVAQRPVRRSGARPGDGLWVTGRLGGAGLALAALRAGRGGRGARGGPPRSCLTAPLRPAGAAHCRGTLAGAPRSARHDRHL